MTIAAKVLLKNSRCYSAVKQLIRLQNVRLKHNQVAPNKLKPSKLKILT
jgi:hypothetical protein